jgi:hypothetical protein
MVGVLFGQVGFHRMLIAPGQGTPVVSCPGFQPSGLEKLRMN